jgi:hypothetical protein
MVCTSCSSEMSSSTRFCPQCGNPAEAEHQHTPAPAVPTTGRAAAGAGTTQVLDLPPVADADATVAQPVAQPADVEAPASRREPAVPVGERAAAAVAPVRRWLAESGLEVQLAIAGTLLVLLAFFFLPFKGELGSAVEIGGRVWWRPITAITATVLLVFALRREIPPSGAQARVVSALALATAGATEAGLLGLVTGNGAGLHAGYYLMLLGMLVVLVAAFLATRHPVRRLAAVD